MVASAIAPRGGMYSPGRRASSSPKFWKQGVKPKELQYSSKSCRTSAISSALCGTAIAIGLIRACQSILIYRKYAAEIQTEHGGHWRGVGNGAAIQREGGPVDRAPVGADIEVAGFEAGDEIGVDEVGSRE